MQCPQDHTLILSILYSSDDDLWNEILWGTFKEHVLILLLCVSSANRIWWGKQQKFGATYPIFDSSNRENSVLFKQREMSNVPFCRVLLAGSNVCAVHVTSYTYGWGSPITLCVTWRQQRTVKRTMNNQKMYLNLLNFFQKLSFFCPNKYTFPFKERFGLGDTEHVRCLSVSAPFETPYIYCLRRWLLKSL